MRAGSTKIAAPTVILKMAAASPRRPITRRRAGPGAVASGTNEIEELRKVDIAAGDNGHDRARTGLAGERSREAERASSLGDDTRLFRHEPHRALYLVQAHDNGTVHDRPHALPHPRKHTLPARAVDVCGLPVWELLLCAPRVRDRDSVETAAVGALRPS